MALPTIVGNDGVTFTFQAGDVQSVREVITGAPEQVPIAATGPASAFVYDFDGVTKMITIEGTLSTAASTRTSSGTVTSIYDQKQWLEKQLHGSQVTRTFSSTYADQTYTGSAFTTTKIVIESMEFEEVAGEPESPRFRITMKVGL